LDRTLRGEDEGGLRRAYFHLTRTTSVILLPPGIGITIC
jgi:hypothetical protein